MPDPTKRRPKNNYLCLSQSISLCRLQTSVVNSWQIFPTSSRGFSDPQYFSSFEGICALETKLSLSTSIWKNIIFLGFAQNQREKEPVNKLSKSLAPVTISAQTKTQICPATFELRGRKFQPVGNTAYTRTHTFANEQSPYLQTFKESSNRFPAWREGAITYLSYRPTRLHKLAESIPRNLFLGSINVYKYSLRRNSLDAAVSNSCFSSRVLVIDVYCKERT